jgi:AraC family transcriptional activator of tynA and feaB
MTQLIEPLKEAGMQECAYSGLPATNELSRFAARNVHIVRSNAGLQRGEVSGRTRAYTVEGFTLLHSTAEGEQVCASAEVRDRRAIAEDGRDRFGFIMQLSGIRQISQLGRVREIQDGGTAFISTGEPYSIDTRAYTRFDSIALYMPSEFLVQRGIRGERFCLQPDVSTSHAHDLVSGTLRLFARDAWNFSREEFYRSARAIADLILLAVSTPADRLCTVSSVRSANIARAKDIVRRRLCEPELTLADIADGAGVTLNYLHKLFRDEGCTLYEYVKRERLQRAYELLQLARSRALSVTDVALSCGFSDSSYFSRSFRQTFGMSPREVRQRN